MILLLFLLRLPRCSLRLRIHPVSVYILQFQRSSGLVQSILYLMCTWQPHSLCKRARASHESCRLSTDTSIVIPYLSKCKRSDEAVQIAKDRYTAKLLRHSGLAFLQSTVVIIILAVKKELQLVHQSLWSPAVR